MSLLYASRAAEFATLGWPAAGASSAAARRPGHPSNMATAIAIQNKRERITRVILVCRQEGVRGGRVAHQAFKPGRPLPAVYSGSGPQLNRAAAASGETCRTRESPKVHPTRGLLLQPRKHRRIRRRLLHAVSHKPCQLAGRGAQREVDQFAGVYPAHFSVRRSLLGWARAVRLVAIERYAKSGHAMPNRNQ